MGSSRRGNRTGDETGVTAWLRARSRREADLEREIQDHLALESEDRAGTGASPDEAAYQARRAFGNVTLVKEDTRESWGLRWLARLFEDLRYAMRLMRRSPVLSSVAVASLALGIGANTAVFSVVNALVLRPLPVPHADTLVIPGVDSGGPAPMWSWSYPTYLQMAGRSDLFEHIGGVSVLDRSNVEVGGAGGSLDPGPVRVAMVTGGYFDTLGLAPLAGRLLTADDDRVAGGHPVAVISYSYWTRRLARARDVIGRPLSFDGTTYTILGVTPAGFTGDWVGYPTDIWVPTAMQSQVMIERPGLLTNDGPVWIRVVARLRGGVSVAAADSALTAWYLSKQNGAAQVRALSPLEIAKQSKTRVTFASASRGYSMERDDLGSAFLIGLCIVGAVLLIACANVANLLLARAAARQSEMSVRLALGAARARLIRQLLTESLVLSTCAGTLGVALASVGTPILNRILGSGQEALWLDLHLDGRLMLFALGISVLTGLLFGVVPAMRASRGSIAKSLGSRTSTGAAARFALGKTLVVAQVALSLVLIAGALLFARTLRNLKVQSLGFDRQHVMFIQAAPDQEGLTGGPLADLMDRIQQRIAGEPGVEAIGESTSSVFGGMGGASPAIVPGYTYGPNEDNWVRWNVVTPQYVQAMGMTFIAGRDFTAGDAAGSPRVAIINETMARYYWKDVNVVGRRFGIRRDTGNEIEVVGVVKDARFESLRDVPERTVYLPYRQDASHLRSLLVVVRSASNANVAPRIRALVQQVDPKLPILHANTIDEQLDQALVTERLMATLSGLFGLLALALTCLGLFGVMSYMTSRRTNEIGVRLALGATRPHVMRLVLNESLVLVVAGIVVGIPVALGALRFTQTTLFGVAPSDLPTLIVTSLLLVAVGALASAVPAYRATAIDPVSALRAE